MVFSRTLPPKTRVEESETCLLKIKKRNGEYKIEHCKEFSWYRHYKEKAVDEKSITAPERHGETEEEDSETESNEI